jgi:hypothetical protein
MSLIRLAARRTSGLVTDLGHGNLDGTDMIMARIAGKRAGGAGSGAGGTDGEI